MPDSRYAAEVDSRHNSSSGFVMVLLSFGFRFTGTVKVPRRKLAVDSVLVKHT